MDQASEHLINRQYPSAYRPGRLSGMRRRSMLYPLTSARQHKQDTGIESMVPLARRSALSRAWFWFWHGTLQALLAVACVVGIAGSAHDIVRDQASVKLFDTAKLCGPDQYVALTGPTKWCFLPDIGYANQIPGDGSTPTWIVFDCAADGPDPSSNAFTAQTQDCSVTSEFDDSSPLPGRLTYGDEVDAVATAEQFGSDTLDVAGSVTYDGVTTQTQDSPKVQLTTDTDSTLAFAALALFFGLWAVKSARRRRTAPWAGALGAALGLGCVCVSIAARQGGGSDSTSIMPNLSAGLPVAVGVGALFALVSWAKWSISSRSAPDPAAVRGRARTDRAAEAYSDDWGIRADRSRNRGRRY